MSGISPSGEGKSEDPGSGNGNKVILPRERGCRESAGQSRHGVAGLASSYASTTSDGVVPPGRD